MITMIFLLSTILMAHANPLPADLDSLPAPPDFMTVRQCPEDQPLIDCFHPHFGLVYGPLEGKAIYRATPGVGSELGAGQTSNPAKALSPRDPHVHDYHLDCQNRANYDYCTAYPRKYFCDGNGRMRGNEEDKGCNSVCQCRKMSGAGCTFFHGGCWDTSKEISADTTGEHTEPGREDDTEDHNGSHGEEDGEDASCSGQVTATNCEKVKDDKHIGSPGSANSDKELVAAPSIEDATETDTTTLTKRGETLGGYYMDCGSIQLTDYCYQHPRNYFCGSLGLLINSEFEWACEDCRCPFIPIGQRPGWCLHAYHPCRKLPAGSLGEHDGPESDSDAAVGVGDGTVDGGSVVPNGNVTAKNANAAAD